MVNNIMELKPVMTKAKALELIIEHVNKKGIPVLDAVIYTEGDAGKINQWMYKGLCEFLIDES